MKVWIIALALAVATSACAVHERTVEKPVAVPAAATTTTYSTPVASTTTVTTPAATTYTTPATTTVYTR
jgi:hypothetical protein